MNPDEHPELDAFLAALSPGDLLPGTVAAIERFGVFVRLDDGPRHPIFPGTGFVSIPELSWRHISAASDAVQVGERVTGKFLHYATWNMEARLSLRATQPDPFQAFADEVTPGRELRGRVTKQAPFGVFVEVADGVEGLVPQPGLGRAGDDVTVVVTGIDRERRRVDLSGRG
ncbi:S1 RNA-binding domain-containing protein [Lentzea nigeriaca]|uniref:S1 RNA-binding domain-containing protein n=1 Tax=Lentzea nigeriaca TaxID=1128665 RepID=UPI00195DC5F9|nr:S1 RNA-binding domain-containing protein [Lentzea nigeriaca]MBM7864922.1 small subunit ribosomal protein S1 [Lentzea nigeriaca]